MCASRAAPLGVCKQSVSDAALLIVGEKREKLTLQVHFEVALSDKVDNDIHTLSIGQFEDLKCSEGSQSAAKVHVDARPFGRPTSSEKVWVLLRT